MLFSNQISAGACADPYKKSYNKDDYADADAIKNNVKKGNVAKILQSQTIMNQREVAPYFEVIDLAVSFGDTTVVRSLSLKLNKGEIGCLLGFSGCGKTTALRTMAGLEQPHQGVIRLHNDILTEANKGVLAMNTAPAKRGMGMVFQDYALFSHLTVAENIGFGLHRWSKSQRNHRVAEMLDLVELTQHANKRISELSGGQQQRIALARALAPKPKLLLLDEPFSNLDMMLREALATKVRDILKVTNTTAILVTHDQHEAFAIADKIGVMHNGGLAQWATPSTLYHKPTSSFVAEFVGEGAIIAGIVEDGIIKTALGHIPCQPMPIHAKDNEMNTNVSIAPLESTATASCEYADASLGKGKGHLKSGTPIKVLIRPDDIVHDDASPLFATVVGRVFRGANYLYQLQLNSGESVLSLIPSHHDYAVGAKINFRVVLEHVILFSGNATSKELWHRI